MARVKLQFIEQAQPIQNAFIESFKQPVAEECLNEHVLSLDDAREDREMEKPPYNVNGRTRSRPLTREEFAARTDELGH